MKHFLRLTFAAVLLPAFLLPACCDSGRAAGRKPTGVSWAFDTQADKELTPHSRVFLRVGRRRVLIASGLTSQFSVVAPSEYPSRRIPAAAVTACSGWWAGQGEDFYVVRRHGRWEVFRRDLDEQAPIPAYRRVKSIPSVLSSARQPFKVVP